MNSVFSLERFGRLFAVQFKTHLLPFLFAFGIFIVAIGGLDLLILTSEMEDKTKAALLLLIVILGCFSLPFLTSLLASHSFKDYHRRANANLMLMLPASSLEKFSTLYIVYILFVPFAFLLAFVGIESHTLSSFIQDILSRYSNSEEIKAVTSALSTSLTYEDLVNGSFVSVKSFGLLWLTLASFQMFFFLGSCFFKSIPFIKTNLVGLGLFIIMSVLFSVFDEFGDSVLSTLGVDHVLTGVEWSALISPCVLLIILTALTWFRFRTMRLE